MIRITLTKKDLKLHNACDEGLLIFRDLYPRGLRTAWNVKSQIALLHSPLRKWLGWAVDNRLIPRLDLREANLSWADLCGANLSWADLRRADLTGTDLRGADLTGANLRWADLRGADLCGADLTGTDLRGADLTSTKGLPQ